ncbi:hypothetical protein [Arthrobacter rhombi]|uniref:hypothetical protein n=1 Tax=Arthrobacter rhombi TaxID=71253 RepID=UPI003FD3B926
MTTMLAMLRQSERYGANWQLHYAGRSRSSMTFLDELAQYVDRVHFYPMGEVGRLNIEQLLTEPWEDCLVYALARNP